MLNDPFSFEAIISRKPTYPDFPLDVLQQMRERPESAEFIGMHYLVQIGAIAPPMPLREPKRKWWQFWKR
jgi:hypothetical protein